MSLFRLRKLADSLSSTDASAALSANQGKALKGLIDALDSAVAGLDYASSIHDHTMAGISDLGAVVVASGENANGKYRIWSDGFKEQWGIHPKQSTSGIKTVNLPVSFSASNDGAIVAPLSSSSGNTKNVINALNLSNFKYYADDNMTNTTLSGSPWRCWGY